MNAEAVVAVSAAVVTMVQLVKWAGLRDNYGPLAVLCLSVLGVGIYTFGGDNWPPLRTDTWPLLSGCIAVMTSAAGVYGFVRSAASALVRATPPPLGGAGSEPPVAGTAATPAPVYLAGWHPVVHDACGHIAFLTKAPNNAGETIETGEAATLAYQLLDVSRPVTCDGCGARLAGATVRDGVWVAVSA